MNSDIRLGFKGQKSFSKYMTKIPYMQGPRVVSEQGSTKKNIKVRLKNTAQKFESTWRGRGSNNITMDLHHIQ